MYCRRIGTAFVNGDFLRHAVQPNRPFEEAPGCGVIAFGCKQEVNCVAEPVNRPIQLLPLSAKSNVSLVHAPTPTDRALAMAKYLGQYRQNLHHPTVNRGVINLTLRSAIISSKLRRPNA